MGPTETRAPVTLRSGAIRAEDGLGPETEAAGLVRAVVKLDLEVIRAPKRTLEDAGAIVHAALPNAGYLVSAPRDALEALRGVAGVEWVSRYLPRYKVAPEIVRVAAPAPSLRQEERVHTVILTLFPDADPERVAAELSLAGYRVTAAGRGPRFGRIVLGLNDGEVFERHRELAERNDVFWVGRRARRVLLNETSRIVGQTGPGASATPLYDAGLLGEGQIAAVLDTGGDVDMCYFGDDAGLPPANKGTAETATNPAQRKVIAYDFLVSSEDPSDNAAWDTQGHGTHVAGTVAADGGTLGTPDGADGMAPLAKLIVQDAGYAVDDCADLPALGCPVTDLHPIFQQAYTQGARVHTNSWGDRENFDDSENYSDGTQDADEFVWANRDFLLIFAAGNSGPNLSTISSPSVGKNVVSIGATGRASAANGLAGFSSKGPTSDGRIKPDLTFPGQGIVSAISDRDITSKNCATGGKSGTSMAAPGAAGLSLLVRQYYTDGFYPTGVKNPANAFVPSAALLKATLVGAGTNMTGEPAIPSMDQGFGRIQLDQVLALPDGRLSLFAMDEGREFSSATDAPEMVGFSVTDGSAPFKVTLVWTDYPSTPAATKHLVNDLDLTVNGPSGAFLGNVYENGASMPGGEPDRLNNVEQVLVQNPQPGDYTVAIAPYEIAMGPQSFAVVVSGKFTSGGTGGTGGSGATGGAGAGGTGAQGGSGGQAGTAGQGGAGAEGGSSGTGPGGTGPGGTGAGGMGAQGATGGSAGNPASSAEGGCSCRIVQQRRSAPWWLALLLLGARRRRKSP